MRASGSSERPCDGNGCACSRRSHLFQSTPTNFMAGDQESKGESSQNLSFNPRPPISWRATFAPTSLRPRCGRFNPRPPISWRATCTITGAARGGRRFNPRPPISWRATRCRSGRWRRRRVSIHAHQFHGGRPAGSRAAARAGACFNPRPPISWRATPPPRLVLDVSIVSIHAHQFHGGRRVIQSGS